jgi:hexosaminidase
MIRTVCRLTAPLIALLAVAHAASAQPLTPAERLPVIPAPASVTPGTGSWQPKGRLPVFLPEATEAQLGRAGIVFRSTDSASVGGPEGYRLAITPRGVTITAARDAGRFYALQTLQQLVEAADGGRVPAVTIADAPRFAWRGLHLDVGRHFQPVSFIKRYLDLMARYKLNVFHWHLTEDQGWRIEIKKYPRLTEVGSCRKETILAKNFSPYVGDGERYCGFYTQEEIREVVAYAAARQITVVPEIEMPGHTAAALAAYPQYACTPGPFEVLTIWGVSEDIFCPTEATFAFLQDIMTEVLALFPSRFIHIGGDEAPKTRWDASPIAQEVIRREGLKDSHELQSWFIQRMERWLAARDRRLIGWDEILEGGLPQGATVMSWRGIGGGIAAARAGHDVVMTPTSHLYFDYYQGDERFEPLAIGGLLTLERVYSYEPIPEALTADQARHILGAQGNVWTEYLKTGASVEYMAYPRALALAEVTWSPRERRSWPSFEARLPQALRTLDRLGVQYRLPHVVGLDADVLTLDSTATVTLSVPIANAVIRFTTDGSDPTATSPRYAAPVTLPVTSAGTRVTARAFTREGKASPPRAATFRRTTYRPAEMTDAGALRPGLAVTYHEASLSRVAALDTLPVMRRTTVSTIARLGSERAEGYGLVFRGYLAVPADAMYEFALASDDGSTFTVGEQLVVDNDGLHGTQERTGMIALRAGRHPITVRFFQAGGGADLWLRVRHASGDWQEIPASWLQHRP